MRLTWRGTLRYAETLEEQRRYRDDVARGDAPQAMWGLEHLPVITTGRRDALVDDARVAAAGYDLVRTERGGLASWDEPGQLVGYLFVDASTLGVRRLVAAIEAGLADWLGTQGLPAGPREGYPGVWVGREKVAAIGQHVSRSITMHGFALNLVNDLRGFSLITPCGITDGGVTSVARLLGAAPSPEVAWTAVGEAVARRVCAPEHTQALDSVGPRM